MSCVIGLDGGRFTTSPIQSESFIHRIFEAAFNRGDLAVIDKWFAPDGITHTLSWDMPTGRMGLKQLIATFRTAFPDLHCTVEDEIHSGDRFAARWTMRGTHQGLFLGNPPTSRPIVVQGLVYARIKNGQVVENWILVDRMSILQQLGLIPPPC